MKFGFRFALIVCCLGAVAASGGHAQGVTMTAEVGFGGYYKVGRWTPVTVTIENRGGPIEGEIRFEKSQTLSLAGAAPGLVPTATYVRPVSVPSNSKKRFNLYARLEKTVSRADVSLRSGRRTIAQQEVKLNALYDEDELIVVYASEKGALSYLASLKSPKPQRRGSTLAVGPGAGGGGTHGQAGAGVVVVQYPRSGGMPDTWIGYDGVDMLCFGRISHRTLSARQQSAIRDWVASGGALVVSGGFDWQRLSDPFFHGLLPISADGVAEITDPRGLSSSYGSPFSSDLPISITTGALESGASVYLAERSTPLIAQMPYGAGTCVFVAFDYAAEPVRSWRGGGQMWLDLMSLGYREGLVASALEREARAQSSPYGYSYSSSSGYTYTSYGSQTPGILSALTFSQMEPPSFGLVGLFLLAYIVCLVPGTYLVLAKVRRRELAWGVMPAIVIVFSVAAYLTSYAVKGGEILLNQIGFVEAGSGSPEAAVDSFALIFSPKRTSYDLSVEAGAAVIEGYGGSEEESLSNWAEGLRYVQADKPTIPGLEMNMWSSRAFQVRSAVDMEGGISLALAGNRASGRITNDTRFDLWDCCLVVPDPGAGTDTVYYLGEIMHGEGVGIEQAVRRAGSTATVQLGGADLRAATGGPTNPELRSMMQRAVEAVYEPSKSAVGGDPFLVAWSHDPLPRIALGGKRPRVQAATMFVIKAPPTDESSAVVYPEAVSSARVTKTTGSANTYDPASLVDLGGESAAEIGIHLRHLGPAVSADSLRVRLSVSGMGRSAKSPSAEISLYNRSLRKWQVFLKDMTVGMGSTAQWRITPSAPGEYVGLDGAIRLRVKTSGGDNHLVVHEAAAQLAGHRR